MTEGKRIKSRKIIIIYSVIVFIILIVATASVLSLVTINRTFRNLSEVLLPSVSTLSEISIDFANARTELYRYIDEYELSAYRIRENLSLAKKKLNEIEKFHLPRNIYYLIVDISTYTAVTSDSALLLQYYIERNNQLKAAEISSILMVRCTTLLEQAELLKKEVGDFIYMSNIKSRKNLIRNTAILTSALSLILLLIIAAVSFQNRHLQKIVNQRTAALESQIAELENTRAALGESETRFETLFNKAPLGYQAVDESGIFTDINETWLSAMGYTREEVIGHFFGEFIIDDDVKLMEESANMLKKLGDIHDSELRLRKKDGSVLYASFEGRVLRNSDGSIRHIYGIFQDTTKRRQLEEQLRQSEKMNAIGQLAGGVAHDFNNQLAGIIGYTDLIKNSLTDERLIKYSDYVLACSQHAADLIRQLLFFARKGQQVALPVDIHGMLSEVESIIRRSIDRKINLRHRLDASCPVVTGDLSQLQNVILNLAINARDAMPDGGDLEISTESVNIKEMTLSETGKSIKPGEYVRISVSDTGKGIPENIRSRIFEPFFTTKEAGKGTGLGLSAVYGTVEEHRGFITLRSEVGTGSVFNIFLPVDSSAGSGSPPDSGESRLTGKQYSILIVDDEEILRNLLGDILKKERHNVISFSGGSDALEFYRDNWQGVDAVVLDMIMPGMNGLEVFRQMKMINPAVRAMISSGFGLENEMKQILDEGIMGFLQKPYKVSVLLSALNEILE